MSCAMSCTILAPPPSAVASQTSGPRSASSASAAGSHLRLSSSFLPAASPQIRQPAILPACHAGTRLRQNRLQVEAAAASTELTKPKSFIDSLLDLFRGVMPQQQQREGEGEEEGASAALRGKRRVMVAGGTGRTGRKIVRRLVEAGHAVVVLASSEERAREVLAGEEGLKIEFAASSGEEEGGAVNGSVAEEWKKGVVRVVVGDLDSEKSVRAAVRGCDAIICSVAARFGPEGFKENSTPQAVYGDGIFRLVAAAQEDLKTEEAAEEQEQVLFDFSGLSATSSSSSGEEEGESGVKVGGEGGTEAVEGWRRMDDVIMGGISESSLKAGNGAAVFEGTVRVEGGGFCATRALFPSAPADLSQFEGIKLRVKGGGQRFKLNIRDSELKGEYQHQASFDTIRGKWVDVFIPFDRFRGVERSRPVAGAPPLNTSQLYSIGLVLSRFQYDGFPNLLFSPGHFKLEVQSISAYRRPLPQFLLVSSAAVERSARAAAPEEREASIPIVKLNPGGVLSWKLTSEDILRASGLRYSVVRPCGLTDEADDTYILEVAQGDALTGRISRDEVAAVCVEALTSPDVVDTTFEVRRDDLTKGLITKDWPGLFRRLRRDAQPGIVQYPVVPADISAAFKG